VTTRWQALDTRQPNPAGERTEGQTSGNGNRNGAGSDQINTFRIPALAGVEVLTAEGAVATGRPVLHNDLEVRFVVRGELRVEFNREVHVARAGWLLQLPPGELHTLAPDEHSFLAIRVGLADLDRYGAGPGTARTAPPTFVCEPAPVDLADMLTAAYVELAGPQVTNGGSGMITVALSALMIRAANGKTHAASSAATRLPAIERALDHLRERYLREISLDDLASAARLSKFHFLRLFSVAVGATPHRYQLLLRIARARELLRLGVEIASVAQSTGFFDQSHFTRCFREIVGITPGRYQNESATRVARNGSPGASGPTNGPQELSEPASARV
jgi:AraC-like DNA-binding protein